jgi:DNA-binding SARP family transcriptional activator
MRSYNATRDPAQIEPLFSRPLLLINNDRQIDWGITGNGESTQGRYCWDVLGCAARSDQQCKAVKCPKPSPVARRRSKSGPVAAYPADVCLISSIQLPFRGQLVWGPQGGNSARTNIDLHVVASLAGAILAKDVTNGGEAVLDLIRIATGADGCKLFLTDLYGKKLLLAACVGSYRSTHIQQQRFVSGAAFADLAFTQGRPVTSRAPSARFLRGEMAEMGVGSVVSVPIPAPDGRVLGCLDLAWHDSAVPVETFADALWSAAAPLGNAICAAYWTLGQQIVRAGSDGSAQPLVKMFQMLHESVGADAGSLVMWDERSHKVQSIDAFGASPPICPWLMSPEAAPCSSRENESCFRLIALTKPDDRWPDACRQMRFDGTTVCCIPVMGQATRSGRAIIGFRHNSPKSPERLLVPLQVMAEQMGLHRQEPNAPEILVARASAIPRLQIRCFGHFEVAIDGQKVPSSAFQRRDALTLLKILVLRAGKQLHRAKLNEWLWPDVAERVGINRLHGVVHALRAVIEPYAAERRWRHVLNEGDTYTFCPDDSTSVDIIDFQKYLALARNDLRDGYFAPHLTHYLEQAVELYRADLYEEDQYSEWCDVERIALQREFVDALASLARSYLTLGDAKKAIHALRRALAHDPSREDLHQELIRCLVRLKRYQEAKEQVCDCVRHLREDLGVAPSSETQALYHSLVNMGSRGESPARR